MRTEARVTPVVESRRTETSKPVGVEKPVAAEKFENRLSPAALYVRYSLFAAIAAAGLGWDLWSKWYVFKKLEPFERQHIWNGSIAGISTQFDIVTTFNTGAVWGIGQNQAWFFACLSMIAVAVVGYFLWTRQAVASWWLTIATALLLGGTLGNLYDRLGLHGWMNETGRVHAVRDFLDFHFFDGRFEWATFNFADVYLVTGGIMLAIQSFLPTRSGRQLNESASRE